MTLKTFMLLSWWCPCRKRTRQFIKMDRLILVSSHLCFHLISLAVCTFNETYRNCSVILLVSPLRVTGEYFDGFSFELNAAYLIYERIIPHTWVLNCCKHIFVCAREYVYILIYARNFQPSWNYVVSQYNGQKLCLAKGLTIFKLCKKTYKIMKIPSSNCFTVK